MTITVYVPLTYLDNFFDFLSDPTATEYKYPDSVSLKPVNNTSIMWVQVNLGIEQWNKVYYNILWKIP